jgi:hypothetical protein
VTQFKDMSTKKLIRKRAEIDTILDWRRNANPGAVVTDIADRDWDDLAGVTWHCPNGHEVPAVAPRFTRFVRHATDGRFGPHTLGEGTRRACEFSGEYVGIKTEDYNKVE